MCTTSSIGLFCVTFTILMKLYKIINLDTICGGRRHVHETFLNLIPGALTICIFKRTGRCSSPTIDHSFYPQKNSSLKNSRRGTFGLSASFLPLVINKQNS